MSEDQEIEPEVPRPETGVLQEGIPQVLPTPKPAGGTQQAGENRFGWNQPEDQSGFGS